MKYHINWAIYTLYADAARTVLLRNERSLWESENHLFVIKFQFRPTTLLIAWCDVLNIHLDCFQRHYWLYDCNTFVLLELVGVLRESHRPLVGKLIILVNNDWNRTLPRGVFEHTTTLLTGQWCSSWTK